MRKIANILSVGFFGNIYGQFHAKADKKIIFEVPEISKTNFYSESGFLKISNLSVDFKRLLGQILCDSGYTGIF